MGGAAKGGDICGPIPIQQICGSNDTRDGRFDFDYRD
jgi:hypothetical protein